MSGKSQGILKWMISGNPGPSRMTSSNFPGHVAQSVGRLTCKSEVLGLIPGLATYLSFFFC